MTIIHLISNAIPNIKNRMHPPMQKKIQNLPYNIERIVTNFAVGIEYGIFGENSSVADVSSILFGDISTFFPYNTISLQILWNKLLNISCAVVIIQSVGSDVLVAIPFMEREYLISSCLRNVAHL